MVQSFVALGRDCQRIVSVYEIWWSDIFCSGMRRSHSRISYVRLLKQRCLNNCGLYFRFLRVFALPHFRDAPEYLSRRFAKHSDDVVLRNILRRVFEKNEMVFVACDDGPLDQSAWRLFAWSSHRWAFSGVALLRRDWANFKIYSFAGVGCFIAIFINPLGWHIYDGLTATLGHFAQAQITEWLSYFQNMTLPGSIPGIIYIFIFIALETRDRGARPIPLESRLLSWLFLFLGIYQFRYMSFFFIFSTVPMAFHIDRLLPRKLNNLEVQRSLLAAGIIGVCALPLTYVQVEADLGLPKMLSEQDALYLETHFPHARVLNHWNVGGILIFFTRGAVPVFVDGRSATAYPDALLHDYFKLSELEVDEAAWDTALAKYHIDAVLWVKAHEQAKAVSRG